MRPPAGGNPDEGRGGPVEKSERGGMQGGRSVRARPSCVLSHGEWTRGFTPGFHISPTSGLYEKRGLPPYAIPSSQGTWQPLGEHETGW